MKPKLPENRPPFAALPDRANPAAPSEKRHDATVAGANQPAESADFPEAHEDPAQSAELERQQDA